MRAGIDPEKVGRRSVDTALDLGSVFRSRDRVQPAGPPPGQLASLGRQPATLAVLSATANLGLLLVGVDKQDRLGREFTDLEEPEKVLASHELANELI